MKDKVNAQVQKVIVLNYDLVEEAKEGEKPKKFRVTEVHNRKGGLIAKHRTEMRGGLGGLMQDGSVTLTGKFIPSSWDTEFGFGEPVPSSSIPVPPAPAPDIPPPAPDMSTLAVPPADISPQSEEAINREEPWPVKRDEDIPF